MWAVSGSPAQAQGRQGVQRREAEVKASWLQGSPHPWLALLSLIEGQPLGGAHS